VKVINEIEHEDGSATYQFDLTDEERAMLLAAGRAHDAFGDLSDETLISQALYRILIIGAVTDTGETKFLKHLEDIPQ